MRKPGVVFVLAVVLAVSGLASATAQTAATSQLDEVAIRAKMTEQVAAWNRGDIPAFMSGYEDSAETTFIGQNISHGYALILERYKKSYSTREQMGTLAFNDLQVRLLPTAAGVTEYAVVTGRFHLERTTKGTAAKDDGIFSLVWHKSAGGWKVLLDHTS